MVKHVDITCIGGWKYKGEQIDVSYSLFRGSSWIKIKVRGGIMIINTDHIVSIKYADKS